MLPMYQPANSHRTPAAMRLLMSRTIADRPAARPCHRSTGPGWSGGAWKGRCVRCIRDDGVPRRGDGPCASTWDPTSNVIAEVAPPPTPPVASPSTPSKRQSRRAYRSWPERRRIRPDRPGHAPDPCRRDRSRAGPSTRTWPSRTRPRKAPYRGRVTRCARRSAVVPESEERPVDRRARGVQPHRSARQEPADDRGRLQDARR